MQILTNANYGMQILNWYNLGKKLYFWSKKTMQIIWCVTGNHCTINSENKKLVTSDKLYNGPLN